MVDLWPHSQLHLRESDLLLKISHYTNCATGRSHASTVWPKKKSRLWLQIQILKLLLTIKLLDPRIIKAYLTGESIPTYLPGHWPSHYFGILPMYLPRDRFLPSELVVPLVDSQYCQNYQIWKHRLDANTRATYFFSWSLEGSFQHNQSNHRSSNAYSLLLFLQSELQNSGHGTDISTHITALMTS
jgi:hypothetical protein